MIKTAVFVYSMMVGASPRYLRSIVGCSLGKVLLIGFQCGGNVIVWQRENHGYGDA